MSSLDVHQLAEAIAKVLDAKQGQPAMAAPAPNVAEIWRKPFLTIPDDLCAIHDCKRSKIYELVAEPGFPPIVSVGRGRMVETHLYVEHLKTKAVRAAPGADCQTDAAPIAQK